MILRRSGPCIWLQVLVGVFLMKDIYSDCRFPEEKITNGYYVYASKIDGKKEMAPELYVLRFKCFSGFSRVGPRFIQCLEGEWTNAVPVCQKMECPEPPTVENADFTIQGVSSNSWFLGTEIAYACEEGYELRDSTATNLVCVMDLKGETAMWKGNIPFCQEKKVCPDPGESKVGRREGSCCLSGDVLHFSCEEEYELVGSHEITCLSNGTWSDSRPVCEPLDVIHCELPPAIPNGVVKGDIEGDFFLPYDEAEIQCDSGYMYRGPTQFPMCEEDGTWEDEFGECEEIFCEAPEPLDNGTIPELLTSNFTVFPYNFEITYLCDEGYRLLGGDSWRFCRREGWTGTTPYCEEIRCPDPGVPEYGDREGENFLVNAKVRFRCFTGYTLLGSVERYCMPNGQWSGELARCDAPGNYCPNPGIPVNGFKSGSSYDSGDKVSFRCQPGFIHLGSEIRECLLNSTWSGSETICRSPYDYDNNAQISEILKFKVSENFEETDGLKVYQGPAGRSLDLTYQGRIILHFAFDVSGSIEEHHFRRSIDFAKAIVNKVGISEGGSRASAVVFGSKAETIFLPMQLKTVDQVLFHLDQIQYTGGGTSASSALAEIKNNIGLEEEADDKVFDKKNKKDVVFIITDGKANMGGSPEAEAKALKDLGVDIYCIGITGDPRVDTLYKIATSSMYGNVERKNVFILKNYAALSFLVQEITNGTLDYSECGLGMESIVVENRGRILGGKESSDPWPWMAALFFMPPGGTKLEDAELKCGGSVINENFILTAAHCIFYEDWKAFEIRRRSKEEIIVKLGLKNIKDETLVQDFGVKMVLVHERYHPGILQRRLYDYDIALLQLDRPIIYSSFIRPVCLPPRVLSQDSLLYSPNEFGWATGWGHDKVVNLNDRNVGFTISQNLKELRLPIQSNERCRKSIEDQRHNINIDPEFFTPRMFCAGDGKTGNDTCKGDSGGPLMQSQMNSDGYVFWTQVGIVSWGMGCGVENTYGFYTHVHSFALWIDEKINAVDEDLELLL